MKGLRARIHLLPPADDDPHEELLLLPLDRVLGIGVFGPEFSSALSTGGMEAENLGPVGSPELRQLLFYFLGEVLGGLADQVAALHLAEDPLSHQRRVGAVNRALVGTGGGGKKRQDTRSADGEDKHGHEHLDERKPAGAPRG